MRALKNIESKINKLSPEAIGDLEHYLDYLINKKSEHKPKKLRQDWAGGLKDLKITAIELQKIALDWRLK